MRIALATLSLLLVGLVFGLVASPTEAGPRTCKPGKPCKCIGSKGCSWTCAGKGCVFEIAGSGGAALFCKQGGCKVAKAGSGPAKIVCQGGGCDVRAAGSGTTLLDCPGKKCSMSCAGNGTCRLVNCKSEKDCKLRCADAKCSRD
jgi:hypothetical protein